MSERAYFLIKLKEGTEQEEVVHEVLTLQEEKGEVEAIDPVVGEYDLIVTIESQDGPEKIEEVLAEKVEGIEKVETLKVVSLDRQFKRAEEKLKAMMAEEE